MNDRREAIVLEVSGVRWASSKAVAESVLSRRPGVVDVEVNPVAQTANVTFDAGVTTVAQLRQWVIDCGYHCAGQSVPDHICDPGHGPGDHGSPSQFAAVDAIGGPHERAAPAAQGAAEHPGDHAPDPHGHGERQSAAQTPQDAMGHGGHHAGASMDGMVRDMRNRFLIALLLSIPITLWSPIGREVLGFSVPAPFGLRDDVFALILSLPVIFYSAWIFFDGAWRALRARTLDMMVLVAVGVGAGWLYSLAITLSGGGEVFYEAASVLATFVLLGHWVEMRARGGANDAIRRLLELAPPRAVVLRDGAEVEVPTSEVVPGDLMLVRPGAKVHLVGVLLAHALDEPRLRLLPRR